MWGATNSTCLEYLTGILAALRSDVDGDYLQSLAELIRADLFSDFLSMAEYLLDGGYKEAAAVLIGGVLEEQLRNLAIKSGVPATVGSRPIKVDQLNADLARANVYSVLYQKNVTAWLDLRNKAAHGKHAEYTKGAGWVNASGCTGFRCTVSGVKPVPLCLAKPDAFRSSPLRRPAPDVTGVSREEFAPERQVSQIRTSWEFRCHFGGISCIRIEGAGPPILGWRPALDRETAPSRLTGTPLWAEPEDTPCDGRCHPLPCF